MCSQIRSMYVMFIEYCNPADPVALFDQHWMQMADDFTRAHPHASNDELRAMVALDLEDILCHRYKTFDDFGIGAITPSLKMRRSVLQMDQGMRNTVLPLLDRELAMYDLSEERRSFD